MQWVCIVVVTLVHKQTTNYQQTAQGPRAAVPHIPQWLKSMVYIPVHMLWDIGAQLCKLGNDIHPLPGPSPPPLSSIRFVTLNGGAPFLSRRRWKRLLQEVTANEPAIVGLQKFRFRTGDNRRAWTASMAKSYTLVSYNTHNPDTMYLVHESVHKYVTILRHYPGREGSGLAIQLALPDMPPPPPPPPRGNAPVTRGRMRAQYPLPHGPPW